MRDIFFLAFFLWTLPLALSSGLVAFLLWTWADLVVINNYVYGFMSAIKYVQLYALVTFLVVLLQYHKKISAYKLNAMIGLMLILLLHGAVSAVLAYPGLERNWEIFGNLAKIIVMCALMPLVLKNRESINLYVLCVVTAIGFHGLLDGLKMVASAGAHNVTGIGKFGDNNHYALILLMVMPLAIYLARYFESLYLRWASFGLFMLMLLAVVGTNSRGALIAAMAGLLWFTLIGKKKIKLLLFGLSLCFVVFIAAPDDWFSRMSTIQEAQEDSSFMGRVAAWKLATAIAIENPLFGGGFYAGQAASTFEVFRNSQGLLPFIETPGLLRPTATHSIYFQILGDLGFNGLLLFVAIFGYVFHVRGEIAKRARETGGIAWANDLANLISVSIVVYLIGGALLSLAYYEIPYYLAILIKLIDVVSQEEVKSVTIALPK
ncbi:O-Antigen ligase family protein [Hydrogenophaga sp. RAC07]|uniref:putative O-glycosylation ligase, exosortase A system-associated n=1 Tax=Hydrogenophaga sp. RAC07 TaxID=1842537 RepID=UPI00083DEE22|nr:putative O-glycosylation ligase, exosortase A system-associated [Hydrogenophaga sp. RAC07]AOF84600.1 O-Antigen ligase family protein [Hydrogenophaga sp. RAC07]